MTATTVHTEPPLYICLISTIDKDVDRDGLFTEIGRILQWDAEQIRATINHSRDHVHTKLFMAPKDLAETRAGVLAARLQNWLSTSPPIPVHHAFRIGVHRNA